MAGNKSRNNGATRREFNTPNPNELTIQNSVLVLIDRRGSDSVMC
jgi:hypothetical protein